MLQYKPGLLVDEALAGDVLDRTATAVAAAREDAAREGVAREGVARGRVARA